MTASVVDASALLALLLNEPGAARVRQSLATSCISAVNLSEVIAHLARLRALPEDPSVIVDRMPIIVVPFDRDQAHDAGKLITLTRSAGHAWIGIAVATGVTLEMIR
jgi:PIN domain nuclease of toxin-antitoxin system